MTGTLGKLNITIPIMVYACLILSLFTLLCEGTDIKDGFPQCTKEGCKGGDAAGLIHAVDPMTCPKIVSRADWKARPARSRIDMKTPVPYVVLHHTLTPECFTYDECCNRMRSIQNYHMDKNRWDDIAYSFLIGSDGLVCEGRGWDTVGSHAPWYNFRSIGISIMGDFTNKLPKKASIDAVNSIINCAIANKKLDPDYALYGHRQATPNRTCPGEALFKEIQTWSHWKPGDHFPPKH